MLKIWHSLWKSKKNQQHHMIWNSNNIWFCRRHFTYRVCHKIENRLADTECVCMSGFKSFSWIAKDSHNNVLSIYEYRFWVNFDISIFSSFIHKFSFWQNLRSLSIEHIASWWKCSSTWMQQQDFIFFGNFDIFIE